MQIKLARNYENTSKAKQKINSQLRETVLKQVVKISNSTYGTLHIIKSILDNQIMYLQQIV